MTVRLQKYLLALTIILSSGCRAKSLELNQSDSDTTKALSLLLDKDFLGRNMPGYGSLQMPNPLGDTIIFIKDTILSQYLNENTNGFHFKFLTQAEVCELAILYNSDRTTFPNFFQLKRFHKVDSIYDIALQVTCVLPLYDRNGKKISDIGTFKNNRCIFGMLCGGGIGVRVYKDNDTLKIKKETSWSD